ncbi:MAG: Hpt domain-containing protein [Mesorhizobium sp.]
MVQNGMIRPVFAPVDGPSGGKNMANRPIDTAHLAQQTMHDADLQREVLLIFIDQLVTARKEISSAQGEARKRLAHKLKGAARAVGAFDLSECAERLMEQPDDLDDLQKLDMLADEAGRFAQLLAG